MGFYVTESGFVGVDHSIKNFGDTTVQTNPTKARTACGLVVHSVFLRQSNRASKSDVGDNCPMIYALKGKQGLYTTKRQIHILNQSFAVILANFVTENCYNYIIPMPSSSNISKILANRVKRSIKHSILLDLFKKISVLDAANQINMSVDLEYADKAALRMAIKRQKNTVGELGEFSLKEVKTPLRKFISPVVIHDHKELPVFTGTPKFLLVDDLFSTGTTLLAAKRAILNLYPTAHVEALCLFSPLNGRIKK